MGRRAQHTCFGNDETLRSAETAPRGRRFFGPPTAGVGSLVSVLTEKPRIVSGPRLRYPERLRQARVQGRVVAAAVIDTTGRAEQGSIKIVESRIPTSAVKRPPISRRRDFGRGGSARVRSGCACRCPWISGFGVSMNLAGNRTQDLRIKSQEVSEPL